mmetsp:Transcript_6659/g.18542  ORF Transcript_6659/g.18542 Transcript_6659/m.18542 type:complete len:258 (-) Transcript_6659:677-1450(-)
MPNAAPHGGRGPTASTAAAPTNAAFAVNSVGYRGLVQRHGDLPEEPPRRAPDFVRPYPQLVQNPRSDAWLDLGKMIQTSSCMKRRLEATARVQPLHLLSQGATCELLFGGLDDPACGVLDVDGFSLERLQNAQGGGLGNGAERAADGVCNDAGAQVHFPWLETVQGIHASHDLARCPQALPDDPRIALLRIHAAFLEEVEHLQGRGLLQQGQRARNGSEDQRLRQSPRAVDGPDALEHSFRHEGRELAGLLGLPRLP